MPRKRKSRLTLGKRYERSKYRKLEKETKVVENDDCNTDEDPNMDWNEDITSLLSSTHDPQSTSDELNEYSDEQVSSFSIRDHIDEITNKMKVAG